MGLYQERTIEPVFRTVYNASGATILRGTILKLDAAGDIGQSVKASAPADQFYGVAVTDILTGTYGNAQIRGVAPVLAGAAVAKGDQVSSDANGKGVTAAAGNTLLGMCVMAAGADNDIMEVELMPGGEAN